MIRREAPSLPSPQGRVAAPPGADGKGQTVLDEDSSLLSGKLRYLTPSAALRAAPPPEGEEEDGGIL